VQREVDLGGAPTEWNDLPLLVEQVRTLVQHGDDPCPWLPRLRELRDSAPPHLQRATDDFLALVQRYLEACREGTPDVHDWKCAVEDFPAARFATPINLQNPVSSRDPAARAQI